MKKEHFSKEKPMRVVIRALAFIVIAIIAILAGAGYLIAREIGLFIQDVCGQEGEEDEQ